ncbi:MULTISPECIES: hypothetical protein [Streptomyces]|uniref:DUF397 domain-containing protein n=1 Tax=Streptomyces eurythermus TaxID=42237 RepID=A0ABW6YVL9_9ACTN|nr:MULTISPECIES: hypothetical protein [Streptomyces]QIS68624.1 hypothetical protein HB370_11465 [Streptomyces sp. DSM 40868]
MTGVESPACVPGHGLPRGRTVVVTDEEWSRALDVTLGGTFRGQHA